MRTHRILAALLPVLCHCGPTTPSAPQPSASEPATDAGPGAFEDASSGAFDDAGNVVTPPPAPSVSVASSPADGGFMSADACPPGAVDEPDDMGADTNCDGADGVVGTDVYVNPAGGQDTNDGSPTGPLQSLAKAQSLANARGGHVLVTGGAWSGDSFPLTGSWSVYGGYSPAFVGPPDRQTTVFTASARGLLVDATTEGLLAHVTIETTASTDSSQRSTHVLKSRAAHLTLHDVSLKGADAAGGATPSPASSGEPGDVSAACGAAPLPAFALGQRYAMMSNDAVTKPGVIDGSGGQPALVAKSGNNGTDGQDAADAIQLSADVVVGSMGTAAQGNGTPGYGGAGGGLDVAWVAGGTSYTIWGGKGGNGGCPGAGGSPGVSGGSSVALVVLAGKVDITTSDLQAGFGGDGGGGAAGGPGGAGQLGAPPELVSPAWSTPLSPTCVPGSAAPDVMNLSCAEYGGQGGTGGSGGHGGAGAGGWSIGILVVPGATYSTDAATTITVRKPGTGGQGASAIGPSGRAATLYFLSP